jgi:hypothetical protein
MPKICYVEKVFSAASLSLISLCNTIIEDYTAQGFMLTLRQMYYQLVSRDIIANKQTEYKRVGSIINDARLAGLIDWQAIEDRTRNLKSLAHWDNPPQILNAVASQYRMDMWETQQYRPEVWIEKDALVGVIEGVCNKFDTPFFSCRGYTSQSEMWGAAMRLERYVANGQTPVIFHFGDHDPSGKDMTRDITDRLRLFMGGIDVRRLALNMDQIGRYKPPPNPAKITDSRAAAYIREFGGESWELDALEPKVLAALIENNITDLLDWDRWDDRQAQIDADQKKLKKVAASWKDIA